MRNAQPLPPDTALQAQARALESVLEVLTGDRRGAHEFVSKFSDWARDPLTQGAGTPGLQIQVIESHSLTRTPKLDLPRGSIFAAHSVKHASWAIVEDGERPHKVRSTETAAVSLLADRLVISVRGYSGDFSDEQMDSSGRIVVARAADDATLQRALVLLVEQAGIPNEAVHKTGARTYERRYGDASWIAQAFPVAAAAAPDDAPEPPKKRPRP